MIKKLTSFITKKEIPLLKVYSHPRSGTHFLEAFLANNFYQDKNLFIPDVTWGHWSNRQVKKEGNSYGKLFGSHKFPYEINENKGPKVYIFRDGRAVAFSVWKTPNFLHADLKNLTFKEFLRVPIDWYGSPSNQAEVNLTILEHWALHVKHWCDFAERDKNMLIIKYEDLVNEPHNQYLRIHNKYFKKTKKLNQNNLNIIKTPVGLLPNQAKVDSWKTVFDKEDLLNYYQIIKSNKIDF